MAAKGENGFVRVASHNATLSGGVVSVWDIAMSRQVTAIGEMTQCHMASLTPSD
jgi:hypothetical protein